MIASISTSYVSPVSEVDLDFSRSLKYGTSVIRSKIDSLPSKT